VKKQLKTVCLKIKTTDKKERERERVRRKY